MTKDERIEKAISAFVVFLSERFPSYPVPSRNALREAMSKDATNELDPEVAEAALKIAATLDEEQLKRLFPQ